MEFIKSIAEVISAFIVIIGAVITIEKFTKGKIITFFQKPVLDKIDKLDLNQCRNYLVEFMADLENNVPKSEVQRQRAYEYYDHYVKDLKGNSYIHDKWEKLKERGMI